MGGGGGEGSLGLPIQTVLLKRPLITGPCHLFPDVTQMLGFSAFIVATLTVLKSKKQNNESTDSYLRKPRKKHFYATNKKWNLLIKKSYACQFVFLPAEEKFWLIFFQDLTVRVVELLFNKFVQLPMEKFIFRIFFHRAKK